MKKTLLFLLAASSSIAACSAAPPSETTGQTAAELVGGYPIVTVRSASPGGDMLSTGTMLTPEWAIVHLASPFDVRVCPTDVASCVPVDAMFTRDGAALESSPQALVRVARPIATGAYPTIATTPVVTGESITCAGLSANEPVSTVQIAGASALRFMFVPSFTPNGASQPGATCFVGNALVGVIESCRIGWMGLCDATNASAWADLVASRVGAAPSYCAGTTCGAVRVGDGVVDCGACAAPPPDCCDSCVAAGGTCHRLMGDRCTCTGGEPAVSASSDATPAPSQRDEGFHRARKRDARAI
jgi:hypothetical protein